MRILVIGSRIPYPLKDGGAIASYQLLQGLSQHGVEVTFKTLNTKKHKIEVSKCKNAFSFLNSSNFMVHDIDTTVNALDAFINLFKSESYNITRFMDDDFGALIKKDLSNNQYDYVLFDNLLTAGYVHFIPKNFKGKTILRQHNIEHQIWEKLRNETFNPLKKWYLGLLAKRLKTFELAILKQFDEIFAITEEDANFLGPYHDNVSVVKVGVEVDKNAILVENKHLYHIGSMEWMPNKEGVHWFLEKVWTKILSYHPDAVFHLAGKGLNKDAYSKYDNVINHGEIEDMDAFVADKSILVVPILSGSGIRVKILEALAKNKYVISTKTGADGLIKPYPIDVSNSGIEMANSINALLSTFPMKPHQTYIKDNYSIKKIYLNLVDKLKVESNKT